MLQSRIDTTGRGIARYTKGGYPNELYISPCWTVISLTKVLCEGLWRSRFLFCRSLIVLFTHLAGGVSIQGSSHHLNRIQSKGKRGLIQIHNTRVIWERMFYVLLTLPCNQWPFCFTIEYGPPSIPMSMFPGWRLCVYVYDRAAGGGGVPFFSQAVCLMEPEIQQKKIPSFFLRIDRQP